MVKLSWKAALAASCMTLGAVTATAAPAAADGTNGPLCEIVSNAYQYDAPLGNYERTVHRGHQFRVHGWKYDRLNRLWAFGHSGESWWDDGYVLDYHIYCGS